MSLHAEFAELYDHWARAVAARDSAALDALFDPGYRYTSPDGQRFDRADIMDLEMRVPPPVLPFHPFEIQQVAGDVVIVRGGHGLRGELPEGSISPELAEQVAAGIDIAFTSVWRRSGDGWRVLSNDAHVVRTN